MELAIEFDELERRFLLLFLLRQQAVQFRRQKFGHLNGAPHTEVLDKAARLHDGLHLSLGDRRNESPFLRHDLQKSVGLESQESLAHWGPRHAGRAANLPFGQERALDSE
jgi:hypothetical protein